MGGGPEWQASIASRRPFVADFPVYMASKFPKRWASAGSLGLGRQSETVHEPLGRERLLGDCWHVADVS